MNRSTLIAYWLGACAPIALLSGCGGSLASPPSGASTQTMPARVSSAPAVTVDKGLYVTLLNGGRVYGYPIDNRRNKSPICSLGGVRPNDVAVDGSGNLVVPSQSASGGTVTVYKGPGMCGPEIGSIADPYGRPTDAAAGTDATTGTLVVGSLTGPYGDDPGSVAVCTLKAGCTRLSTGRAQYIGAVALARNGDCWASAEYVDYSAFLIYYRGCAKNGVVAKHFSNRFVGGLDIDDAGHLVSISYGDNKLYVYSGCNPTCVLVGGPLALRGYGPYYGHLNESSTRLAVGGGDPAEVDVYAYSPTHIRFLYRFRKGLGRGGYDFAAAAYNPRSKE